MASSGKRKTTMAKLNRERKLVEKRLEKQARKVARKRAAAEEAAAYDEAYTAEPDGDAPVSEPDEALAASRD
jgi:hypothetical protein